jgi:excisionase family DNA binding protein
MADRLLTARELQDFLKIDRITVYRMVESGDLPGIKVGGQWRFSQATVDEWLQARVSKGTPHGGPAAAQSRAAQALPPTEALSIASRPLASLQVSDLVAPTCLEILQGSFAEALNVAVGITNLTGWPLVPMSNPCGFCQAGWSSAEFWRRCQLSWSEVSDASEGEARLRLCHAGISFAVAPVQVRGQRLGLVVSGQFLATAPDDGFRRSLCGTAKDCGLDERLLLSEMGSIRVMDAERQQLVSKLLVTIASALSEIATQNYHVREKLAQIAQIVKAS